jgi:catechol 2,3-dioxygenase-like lactoylglutathione lyase family enzyme
MIVLADVAVTVRDARARARWWNETMGFAVHTIGPPDGHAVVVAPPWERFVLHLCEGFAPLEPGNTGIAFVTDELEALAGRMRAHGVRFPEPVARTEFGGSAKFEDPDGNVFWLLGAPSEFVRAEAARRAPAAPEPAPPGTADRA